MSCIITAFTVTGGVIEACPPTESITTLTANMLIEPNGQVNIMCSGDQIHAESPFHTWGMSVPQASVEPSILSAMCKHIGEACKSRGIVGYVEVDFVTFINPVSVSEGLALYCCSNWCFQIIAHLNHKSCFMIVEMLAECKSSCKN